MQLKKKIRKNTLLLCLGLVLMSIKSFGQTEPKLYIAIAGLNPSQEEYIKQEKLSQINIFYQKEVTTDGLNLDVKMFKEHIEKRTNLNSKGIAIIDWEGLAFKALSGSSDAKAEMIIKQFLKALDIAKQMRPNLKWGFYGLPVRTFNGNNANWRKINTRLLPIFKKVDVIAPSLYIYNASPKVYNVKLPLTERGSGDHLYVNLDYALKLAKQYNKEVYPFIWHKRNSGKSNEALSLIPIDIFKNYYTMISSRVSSGKKVSGVIWWDSQKYYYLNRKKYPALEKEYQGVVDVEKYDYDIFKKYYRATK
ncbi:hyaluronidase [Sphingobacterium faecium]|uniref:hypothetical protein n=1 Tax=Sphingobacterium TaxID=28453 RepID=UPI001617AFA8|nr:MULTISPECIES: hypothetical protein [Sphingobacterium]MBB2954366.1 hypothetical protein [Sphingobacterium sp. JUb56]UXD69338.1 hyaluronidase [Sphingobacterium faecium]